LAEAQLWRRRQRFGSFTVLCSSSPRAVNDPTNHPPPRRCSPPGHCRRFFYSIRSHTPLSTLLSTSTINKFDLGHKNHKKTEFLRQPNLSTNLQKKIDRSTDKFGFLGHRFEICQHVDKFQICQFVDSSKHPQIDRSTINKFGFLGHPNVTIGLRN
jgi:hypothetical protein